MPRGEERLPSCCEGLCPGGCGGSPRAIPGWAPQGDLVRPWDESLKPSQLQVPGTGGPHTGTPQDGRDKGTGCAGGWSIPRQGQALLFLAPGL